MKGDFSRRTFDKRRRFSRVLMQQGRVLVDADWNEQVSILLHYLRSVVADLHGPVVAVGDAFKIVKIEDEDGEVRTDDFSIEGGHLYVDGILCEHDPSSLYAGQHDFPVDKATIRGTQLVYLDVWERHITHVQDPRIREVALGGPDTTTRAVVTWQVRLHELDAGESCGALQGLVEELQPSARGALQARTKDPTGVSEDDPCITPPDARYRGADNRLYRVEIHEGGAAGDATFKWSRDNGSVVLPILSLKGNRARVETLGADEVSGVSTGSWVEVLDDHAVLLQEPGALAEVEAIDAVELAVELSFASSTSAYDEDATTHPILRRWDYRHGVEDGGEEAKDGGLLVEEDTWITLEDGIEVRFAPAGGGASHTYRTGDYWLIPARTETGDVEWPRVDGDPEAQAPHGVQHHYAALAVVSFDGDGELIDCLADHRVEAG